MAENRQLMDVNPQQITPRSLIWTTIAGITIEGPILGLMGFSFLSSLILLVITSPLLIIFSPLLIGAACVFLLAMAGFGVAGITAVFGLSSFVVVYRSLIKDRKIGQKYSDDKVIQPAETDEEEEQQQDDTEVPVIFHTGTTDRIEPDEAVKEQQQGVITEPVAVDRMVELFESLKDDTPAVTIINVVDESEDMPSSGGYLQQNVHRQIPVQEV
ncbi:oleosin S1-2 isoform X1 [Lycium barbarum]|uniref:oleosin S1-2 isoform X1 n=1 Tax=Lycium barbarum TaxID=112863 RepID=UPI00293E4B3D|nr:oleosin S1-2 isoform X1 [Lycium barbarum]